MENLNEMDIEENKLKNKHAIALQEKLMQACIDYCRENECKIDEVSFRADCLTCSIEHGSWHPGSDSAIYIQIMNDDGSLSEQTYC